MTYAFHVLHFCIYRLSPNSTARNYFRLSSKEQGSTPRASWRRSRWTLYQNQPKQHMLLLEGPWILPAEASETRSPSLVHPVTPGNDVDNKHVIIFVPSHCFCVLGVILLWKNCCISVFVIHSIAFWKEKKNV